MRDPRYTPLRHKMLAELDAGVYRVHIGSQFSLIYKDTDAWVRGPGRRTVMDLRWMISYERMSGRSPASLNEDGKRLLATWQSQHGEPR